MGEIREPESKILSLDDLEHIRRENKDKKIVFTVGCYDLIHKGHIFFLNECAKLGDLLIVGLARDSTIKLLKGPGRPLNSELNRLQLVSSLQNVDYTVLHPDMVAENREAEYLSTKMDFKEILEKLRPDFFALGYDTVSSEGKRKMCEELGIKVHTITKSVNDDQNKPLSSTSIIQRARKD